MLNGQNGRAIKDKGVSVSNASNEAVASAASLPKGLANEDVPVFVVFR